MTKPARMLVKELMAATSRASLVGDRSRCFLPVGLRPLMMVQHGHHLGIQCVPEDVVVVLAVTGHGNHGAEADAQRVEDLSCCIDPNLQEAMLPSHGLEWQELCFL